MDINKETEVKTVNLCCQCMEITVGDCENLLIEKGYRTVINNGVVEEFIYDR